MVDPALLPPLPPLPTRSPLDPAPTHPLTSTTNATNPPPSLAILPPRSRKSSRRSPTPSTDRSQQVGVGTPKDQEGREAKKRKIASGKGQKRTITVPRVPRVFEEGGEEAKAALKRGLAPATSKNLLAAIEADSETYSTAYEALNQELIKAQIEFSVLEHLVAVVRSQRDFMKATS